MTALARTATEDLYDRYVVPTAKRGLTLLKGRGRRVWDEQGRKYLDLGGGVAVNSLGHAHPAVRATLARQAQVLIHSSNVYYNPWQAELAQRLVGLTGPGKMFFCNSGAEANEGLIKLARKFGHASGRYEIITTANSFHGRTMATSFRDRARTRSSTVSSRWFPVSGTFRSTTWRRSRPRSHPRRRRS